MRYFLKLTALIFWLCTTSNAFAADEATTASQNYAVVEIPIYAQKLRFKIPTNWQHANTSQNQDNYLIEFIPKSESIENWANLFSVQGIKDFDPAVKPEDVANSVAKRFAQACPKNVIYTKLGAQFISDQEAFLAVIGCSEIPADQVANLKAGMSEISYYAFIKGQRDMYILHKSIRGVGFAPVKFPPFVEQAMADMSSFLPIEFCTLESPKGTCTK